MVKPLLVLYGTQPVLVVLVILKSSGAYAAHARANASVCSLGKEPDLASSRVCLPPSSLTNESSQYCCGDFVKAILTVSCSRKSVMDN